MVTKLQFCIFNNSSAGTRNTVSGRLIRFRSLYLSSLLRILNLVPGLRILHFVTTLYILNLVTTLHILNLVPGLHILNLVPGLRILYFMALLATGESHARHQKTAYDQTSQ
jgi:hypothetical protein